MKGSILNKSFNYNIEAPLEKVIYKISTNTFQGTNCGNKNMDFSGVVRENNFIIQANVSSATVRRGLFNPVLYGVLEEEMVSRIYMLK